MKRRTFITGSAALLAAPDIVRAQGVNGTRRLAILTTAQPVSEMTASGDVKYRALFEELRRLGYVEGQNLTVLRYSAEGHQDRYSEVAKHAIDVAPDVILAFGLMALACKSLAVTVPLVFVYADPVAYGLVASLARPGGSMTGVTTNAGLELWGKRLSILREAAQELKSLYFLTSKADETGAAVRHAAEELGLSISAITLTGDINENTYAQVFETMKARGADGLVVSVTSENLTYRRVIVKLANQFKLPAVYPYRDYIVDGGLLSYGIDLSELNVLAAGQIARILGGMKPAEIPVLEPTRFQLIANVKAAQAIGMTLPSSLLLRADEVIE